MARLSMNTLHAAFPRQLSLGFVTFSGPPIHRTLLQQTFFFKGVFESSSFYSHPP
jgi:hypothetical protein